ncbi:MAG: orotate phosphoribosyltransferase [Saprospiraceae bacterium]|nr:orotate phosphoribosyltransferase [Saprospiraceae bacterium]MCB9323455.1 orotate phosphoribosyltransferase [Lewinellaceae bacterium]
MASNIASKLLQINAIKLSPQNPFTWASGMKSPIYCDNRMILSYPDIRKAVVEAFVEKAKAFGPIDVVVGVATAGIPHGALVAEKMGLPFIYVRSKAKAHGRQNQIEGKVNSGDRALVIEDLISTGGSVLTAVEALRQENIEVSGVMAIFTYGFEKADRAFEEANCPFTTLSNYEALLDEAAKEQYISESEKAVLNDWRKAPELWKV